MSDLYREIIGIYGVPRSGTSWLGTIIDSSPDVVYRYQPLFSYRFKSRIQFESTNEDIGAFFEELYCENNDSFLNQTLERESGKYPIFEKNTNKGILAYKEVRYLYTIPLLLKRVPDIRIIGIIRNPYDVIQSWINAPKEFSDNWQILDEWYFGQSKNEWRPENYYGYAKWKEYIKLVETMKNEFPDTFMVVRYEDLSSNTNEVVKEIFEFSNIQYTAQTEQFIKESTSKTVSDAYAVYRDHKKQKSSKNILPPIVYDKIQQDLITFETARQFGY